MLHAPERTITCTKTRENQGEHWLFFCRDCISGVVEMNQKAFPESLCLSLSLLGDVYVICVLRVLPP